MKKSIGTHEDKIKSKWGGCQNSQMNSEIANSTNSAGEVHAVGYQRRECLFNYDCGSRLVGKNKTFILF